MNSEPAIVINWYRCLPQRGSDCGHKLNPYIKNTMGLGLNDGAHINLLGDNSLKPEDCLRDWQSNEERRSDYVCEPWAISAAGRISLIGLLFELISKYYHILSKSWLSRIYLSFLRILYDFILCHLNSWICLKIRCYRKDSLWYQRRKFPINTPSYWGVPPNSKVTTHRRPKLVAFPWLLIRYWLHDFEVYRIKPFDLYPHNWQRKEVNFS